MSLEQEDEEAEQPAAQQKSLFTVRMVKFDESKKVAVIKEVKNLISGMNLVQVSQLASTALSHVYNKFCYKMCNFFKIKEQYM